MSGAARFLRIVGGAVVCAASVTACTTHHSSVQLHESGGAGGPLKHFYAYGSAANPFIAFMPRPGQQPAVSAAAARTAVEHPQSWPSGASRDDLVAFGYGRITAPQAGSAGAGSPGPFAHPVLAWVAIYRSPTTGIPIPPCAPPTPAHGFHYGNTPRQSGDVLLAVIVDGESGEQATWTNLRSGCPQLVRNRPRADGTVFGTFLAIGGPLGAQPALQRGRVTLRTPGRTPISVPVGPNGRFRFYAPAGRYRLVGRTPQFGGPGHEALCRALHRVQVRRGHDTQANVYCQRN